MLVSWIPKHTTERSFFFYVLCLSWYWAELTFHYFLSFVGLWSFFSFYLMSVHVCSSIYKRSLGMFFAAFFNKSFWLRHIPWVSNIPSHIFTLCALTCPCHFLMLNINLRFLSVFSNILSLFTCTCHGILSIKPHSCCRKTLLHLCVDFPNFITTSWMKKFISYY